MHGPEFQTGYDPANPHGGQPLLVTGLSLEKATAAMILVHGRGASARDILSLADELADPSFAYLAPQAAGNSWYPYSFLSPMQQNEPGLSSGLALLGRLVEQVEAAGIQPSQLVLCGFSQGACLASEYVARHPRHYGGLLIFSGGLIGPPGTPRDYAGSLAGTPVFIGCSDVDSHIPLERVHETTACLRQMGAVVDERIYPGMGHTIIPDELTAAAEIVRSVSS